MDLFELVGRLAIEGVDKAKQDLDGVAAAGEKTQGRLSKFFSGVGKAVAGTLVARPYLFTDNNHRHMLSGMVGGRCSRVAAVVCGNNE